MKTLGFRPAAPYGRSQKAPGGSPGTPGRSGSRLQRLSSLPLGEGRGDGALSPPLPPGEGRGEGTSAPRAFTLVELIVVIAVISAITALAVPAAMRALRTAKDAAIKTEVDMLHMAVMNYRNEYGNFPPAVSGISNNSDPAVKHLRRLFVRCPNAIGQLTAVLKGTTISPANALGFWLSGYTGSPEFPLSLAGAGRRPLYDFDRSRLASSTFRYSLKYTAGAPVIYIDSARYLDADGEMLDGKTFYVWRDDLNFSPNKAPPPSLKTDPNQAVLHPDSFQIICAGRDAEFYTDDDISNMWPGTWDEWKKKSLAGN